MNTQRLLPASLLLALAACNKTPDNRILLSGNIELKQVDISFKTPGRLVELGGLHDGCERAAGA